MGSYLIPGATSVQEAANYLGEPVLSASWEVVPGGVLFIDTELNDAQCEALYLSYVPSGVTDADYRLPPPAVVQGAIDTLRAFWDANPATVTAAESARLHRAHTAIERFLYRDMQD